MAEQLLDRAQVRATVQKVGCEAVTQSVWGDPTGHADPTHPRAQASTHVAGAKSPPGATQEQGSLIVGLARRVCRRPLADPGSYWPRLDQRGTSVLKVVTQGPKRDLSGRHETGLGTLALDPELLGFVIHVFDIQGHDLLRTQATRVGELEQGTIAYVKRSTATAGRDAVKQASDFRRLQNLRQMRATTRGGQQIGGILLDQAVLA